MIKVEKLSKSFGKHEVLKNISTTIAEGEVVAVIGPSGSGKSTFLRCLNLLEKPNGGTITIKDTEITKPKTNTLKVRENIGMVFSAFSSLSAQNGSRKHHVRACQCKKRIKTGCTGES